ncbi:MAG: hypothetical protein U1A72_15695 [Sulfuritalea sp.]|nr:hypothetical protein [Sulfuritalea sp.]
MYIDSPSGTGVNVDMDLATVGSGTAIDGMGGTDTFTGIEGVTGTRYADTITGGSGNDSLLGGGGRHSL